MERARKALDRFGLTQKELSIEEPPLAAWSTINGFFNGRAIDHLIFKEICLRLDLNWQEICDRPANAEPLEDEVSQESQQVEEPLEDTLLSATLWQATAARTALTPRILERIPREIVRKKYLPAIARGVEANHQRVIPIIGPAGYGKSTILGDLYDELQQRETAWVGLVLCSLLAIEASPSPQSLAIALGQAVSGEPQSIIALARQLTEQYGRGVLLIDTLDLVISRTFVSAFSHLLRSLLEVGVTVVFTCRDHEYNDFLEPNREKLVGIAECVDRHTVPGFTPDEIRQAATSFFTRSKPTSSEQGQAFADNILKLSADNRSLHEITQNPLLLALLCDLFAKDGNVPADLTVSKLYKRYWYEKITYSRSDDSHSSLLAIHKEDLCLAIARSLFERSQEKLIESAYRDELQTTFSEPVADAFDDLLSEGVLERLPSQKIHFFHQTLLEYAIAYWLTRHAAQIQRQEWLSLLQEANAARVYTYWYPVLRQHLTIVETDEEFEQLVTQLGTNNVAIFSA
ncbi:MAG TPA: ATP-binding protein, partial [Allocoleopsis sp.]